MLLQDDTILLTLDPDLKAKLDQAKELAKEVIKIQTRTKISLSNPGFQKDKKGVLLSSKYSYWSEWANSAGT